MHDHQCRYCLGKFVCADGSDECFEKYKTCDDCWWTHDFRWFLFGLILAFIAAGMTLFLYNELTNQAVK